MAVFKEADPSSLYVLTYAILMLSIPVSPNILKEPVYISAVNTDQQMQSYTIPGGYRLK
jgi:hypothetical protein